MQLIDDIRGIDWFEGEPPLALRIIAGMLWLNAVLACVNMLSGPFGGYIRLDLGVIGFWSAPALLRYRPGWRLFELAMSSIGVGVLLFAVYLALFTDAPAQYDFGPWKRPIADWHPFVAFPQAAFECGFTIWALTHAKLRDRFVEPVPSPAQAPG